MKPKKIRLLTKPKHPNPWFSIENKKEETANMYLFGEVGWEINESEVAKMLDDVTAPKLNVWINSPGGSAFTGIAIYNMLRNSDKEITTKIVGLAASAASLIALAADKVEIADTASIMIHRASIWASGNSGDLRKTADVLDKLDQQIVTAYQRKTNADRADILIKMQDETWFNSDEAIAYGLADEVTESLEVAACLQVQHVETEPESEAIETEPGNKDFQEKPVKTAPACVTEMRREIVKDKLKMEGLL